MIKEKIFKFVRYIIAPISVVFVFLELAYITIVIQAVISLLNITNIYGYDFEKDDRLNFFGGFLMQIVLIALAYYSSNLSATILFATASMLINLYFTNIIMKKMGWGKSINQEKNNEK